MYHLTRRTVGAFRDTCGDASEISGAMTNDGKMSELSDLAVQLAAQEAQLSALSNVPPEYAAAMDDAKGLSAAATTSAASVEQLLAVLRTWASVSTTILDGINGTNGQTPGTAVESLSAFISTLAPAVQECNSTDVSFFESKLEASAPRAGGEGVEGPVTATPGLAPQEEISRLQRELDALVVKAGEIPGASIVLYARIVHLRAYISALQAQVSAGTSGQTVKIDPILHEMIVIAVGLGGVFSFCCQNAADALESLNQLSIRLQEDQPLVPAMQGIFAQAYTEDVTNISKTIDGIIRATAA